MVSESLLGPQLTIRKLNVLARDVVFVKSIIQASEGICCVFSDGGGELLLAAAEDRAADLHRLADDLELELRIDSNDSGVSLTTTDRE
jgi:hypothetical protein